MQRLAGFLDGAPASGLLLASILIVSLLGLYVWPGIITRNVLRPHGLVQRRDFETLITSAFIHADVPHLLFNGITFFAFAFDLERRLGTPAFVVLYGFGLLASSIATWAIHRNQPDYSSLGASGAILAVLFAAIILFPGASLIVFPLPIPLPAPVFAIAYLAYSVFASRTRLGVVNHDAHIAGAVAGLVFVALFVPGAFENALEVWLR